MNFMNSFLYRACEWIMKLAFVNALWVCFSVLGLFILGFFPSTTAMFYVLRKWVSGHPDIPIFRTFWDTYKSEWVKSNLYGGFLLCIVAIIFVDFTIIKNSSAQTLLIEWSKYPLLLIIILFSLLLLYTFPAYVHYNVSLLTVLKNALLIMLINPFYNVVMLLGLALFYTFVHILPALAVFFGGSVSALIIMWSCYQSFLNIDRKKEKLKTTSKQP